MGWNDGMMRYFLYVPNTVTLSHRVSGSPVQRALDMPKLHSAPRLPAASFIPSNPMGCMMFHRSTGLRISCAPSVMTVEQKQPMQGYLFRRWPKISSSVREPGESDRLDEKDKDPMISNDMIWVVFTLIWGR